MDISSRTAVDTFDLELIDPRSGDTLRNEADEPCVITLHGPASRAFKTAQAAANNRLLERMKRKGKAAVVTAEEDDAARAAFLTSITVRLTGFDYRGSANEDAVRAMYLDAGLGWIAEQVNSAAGDWGNFTMAAPTS